MNSSRLISVGTYIGIVELEVAAAELEDGCFEALDVVELDVVSLRPMEAFLRYCQRDVLHIPVSHF